ncbi:hypothetical protein Gogos_005641, partial [Gossypium gossypioides]|nr:hypothetical protein [Gossypium gossypioides]
EFSVRSAYKLLENSGYNPRAYALQIDYRNFYKKLLLQNLPTKIKITIWRISWNYLPTLVNMQHRKLVNNTICPRCGRGAETSDHLFRECLVSVEAWTTLSFLNILIAINMDFIQWLTWVFYHYPLTTVDYSVVRNGTFGEIKMLECMRRKLAPEIRKWSHPPSDIVKINFDGAYDGRHHQSASGIVARNASETGLLSCSEIYQEVAFAFAAEALACRRAVQIATKSLKKSEEFYLLKNVPGYAKNKRKLIGCKNRTESGRRRGKDKGKPQLADE